MTNIRFDEPHTWLPLVESALVDPATLLERLKTAEVEVAYWDCSGLDHVFSSSELQSLLTRIEARLSGNSVRLYHGCRLDDGCDPRIGGMSPSSCAGIAEALLKLAANDPVLKNHVNAITESLASPEFEEQVISRDAQIWFCLTKQEMIEDGGVYVAFGSEFRLLILNSIDESLARRLFNYGTPAIVVVELEIDSYLVEFKRRIAQFLLSLWIHHRLVLDDENAPRGFACWIHEGVPATAVVDVMQTDQVYDHYNTDCRWYSWSEIDLARPAEQTKA